MTAEERRQLASIAAVYEQADQVLDRLFATVAELRVLLGRDEPGVPGAAATEVPVTEPVPQPVPPPAPSGTALEAADRLSGAVEGMRDELGAIRERLATAEERQAAAEKALRRSRHIITGLIISFCLDIAITAGLGYNTVRQNNIQNSSHSDLISSCRQGNVDRVQDAAIWDTFLDDIAPPSARTPKIKTLLAGIDKRIAVKDTPKNCIKAYSTASGGK